MVGQIIAGGFGDLLIRQKSNEQLELGELLVTDDINQYTIFQIYDLKYGSQIAKESLEMMSGMNLEGYGESLDFLDPNLRTYILARARSVVTIRKTNAHTPKTLPSFFAHLRKITKEDLSFIQKPAYPLYLGNIRSGSKLMPIDIFLDGQNVFSHHILLAATTGRGKSNLLKTLLWSALDQPYCANLVFDPHDEYYGRNELVLKDHPKSRELLEYYSPEPPAGTKTLKINLSILKPWHFEGAIEFSDAQKDLMYTFYNNFHLEWIENLIISQDEGEFYRKETINVVKRKLMRLLSISVAEDEITCNSIFDQTAGATITDDIIRSLDQSKTVIIDTSALSSAIEILVSSIITTELFSKYKKYRKDGTLNTKPIINIVLEEAPRVIGKEVLQKGPNVFSSIAREGRKFNIGLTAITQLPSLIPKEILANLNTKIIMGIEMQQEREAIISSAAQDLTSDDRNIASLDKGEAIISSTFTKFAIPIKVPFFDDFAKTQIKNNPKEKKAFTGIKF
ncbi:DUF87 domain-containing protein [archaeon]|nr:DUF87 domain-containing protein [archaeon]